MSQIDQADKTNWTLLFLGWLLVSVSATISLFFSSVLEYEPCVLCWYQRICLFPMILSIKGLLNMLSRCRLRVG
mgnify:CR=1 FL=1